MKNSETTTVDLSDISTGSEKTCNGCTCLTVEEWQPKGTKVAKCLGNNNGPHWSKRVVDHSRTGTIVTVQRPAWCREKI